MPAPFDLPFVQRGLFEVLLLSVGAGLIGTWIVLRGLAFFSHSLATAAFPGLVVADGLGFAPPLGALGAAALFTFGVGRLRARRPDDPDAAPALVLVGALAAGIILASDVFHSGANVETLLFGSLIVLEPRDLAIAATVSALTVIATWLAGPRWLAAGFDPGAAPALGLRGRLLDIALLTLVALVTVSVLAAVGALLATAILVVPAATARLWTERMTSWQLASVALAAVEGVAGLWLAVEFNAPPGAAIAVIAGGTFALAALARALPQTTLRAAATGTALVAIVLLGGCGAGTGGGRGLTVVASTTQLGDFVRQVGGDRVTVAQILQPNTDPHEYEPRPGDVKATASAKLVFVSGDRLDTWMAKVVQRSGSGAKVVDIGAGVPVKLPGETSGPQASRYDPHWWHDPVNTEAAVGEIRDALIATDPGGRKDYEQNAARYEARLQAVDSSIRSCLQAVPKTQRKLVTSHDAFGYFAARYGITVIGAIIPSQTTAAQPSAGDIARLVAQIRRESVRAIFLESSVNPKLGEAVARQTGAIGNLTLYGDTLGPAGSPGATYVGMERANADAMARGMSGGGSHC